MSDEDRAARLAAALRVNLKRRKTQARAAEDVPGNPHTDQRSDSDPIE